MMWLVVVLIILILAFVYFRRENFTGVMAAHRYTNYPTEGSKCPDGPNCGYYHASTDYHSYTPSSNPCLECDSCGVLSYI